jgi:hypothetical protein
MVADALTKPLGSYEVRRFHGGLSGTAARARRPAPGAGAHASYLIRLSLVSMAVSRHVSASSGDHAAAIRCLVASARFAGGLLFASFNEFVE